MRSVDKAIILMLGRAFSSSTVMLLSILLARSLSKTDYGTYVQTSMLVQLCGFLLTFGIPSSLTYFLPKAVDRGKLILRSYGILVVIGIIGAFVLICSKSYVSMFFNNNKLSELIIYAGLGVLFFLSSQVTRPILMFNKSTLLLAKIEIFRSILFLCAMGISVAFAPKLSLVILILIACFLFDFIVSLIVVVRSVANNKNSTEKSVPVLDQIRYSLPLGTLALCWYSGRELDKYVISHYMNPDELALYSRGAIELPLVHILASTISQLKLPDWVAHWDKGNSASLITEWHRTVIKAALVLFPAFILLELLGKHFISLLYSEKYVQSAEIFHIYLLMLPLQITSYTAIVESTGKNRFVLIGYLIQLPISVVISAYSIRYCGWSGPALVSVVGMYAWTIYILIVIANIFKIPFAVVFPWRKLGKIMLISIISCVIPLVLTLSTNTYFIKIILQKEVLHAFTIFLNSIVFASCYGFLAVKFSLVDQEDIDTICRWLLIEKVKRLFSKM